MIRFLILLPLLAHPLMAQGPRVEIVGPPGALHPVPVYTASPGGSFRIDLSIESPLGSKVDLHASTHYVTQGLRAPLQAHLLLAEGITFSDTTRRIIPVEIPIPEITGPATLRVNLTPSPPGNKETPPYFHLRIAASAEKETLSRTLTTALEKSQQRLAVYGESPHLRRFFEEFGIDVKDFGALRPAALPEGYLVMSEDVPPPREEGVSGRLLLFHQSPERLLPGVYQRASALGRVTLVTFPLFTNQSPSLLVELLCEELL